jgi:hypothetical protein
MNDQQHFVILDVHGKHWRTIIAQYEKDLKEALEASVDIVTQISTTKKELQAQL